MCYFNVVHLKEKDKESCPQIDDFKTNCIFKNGPTPKTVN